MKKIDTVRTDSDELLFTTLHPLSVLVRSGTLWLLVFIGLLAGIGYVVPHQVVLETKATLLLPANAGGSVRAGRGGVLQRLWQAEGAVVGQGDTLGTLHVPGQPTIDVLTAPMAGRFTNPNLYTVGETLPAAQEVFRIETTRPTPPIVRLYLSAHERDQVRVGLPVRLRFGHGPTPYRGQVAAIGQEPTTAGYVVRVWLPTPLPPAVPTEAARAEVILSQTRLTTYLTRQAFALVHLN